MYSIMLPLSTFRQSKKTIAPTNEKAREGKSSILGFVVYVYLTRDLIWIDLGVYLELREEYEEEFHGHQKRPRDKYVTQRILKDTKMDKKILNRTKKAGG